MTKQDAKRGRGRPAKHGEAMTGAERQYLYARSRQRDMAEVAYALKDVLARTKANQKAFSDSYQGTQSGARLRWGLARLLADDPDALAFFDDLIGRGYGFRRVGLPAPGACPSSGSTACASTSVCASGRLQQMPGFGANALSEADLDALVAYLHHVAQHKNLL